MNGLDIMDSIGNIDPKFIESAENSKIKKERKTKRISTKTWGLLAASICLVALVGVIYIISRNTPEPPTPNTSQFANNDVDVSTAKGVYIPAAQMPAGLSGDAAADMIGLVVYRGKIYTESEFYDLVYRGNTYKENEYYDLEGTLKLEPLLDEYLGKATGKIDEWSDKKEYETDFASTLGGSVYSVDGYSTDFRICIKNEYTDDDGTKHLSITFMDRLNGITLTTGKDLFEDRLQISGNIESIAWQSHNDWNYAIKNYHELDMNSKQWTEFMNAVDAAEFEYLWSENNPSSIYNIEKQLHLILNMKDGTQVPLRLIAGGYVGYEPLGWYFVKVPEDTFNALYSMCTE